MHTSTQNKACPESTFLCEKVSYSIPAINVRVLSHAQFFATPLTVAHQVPCPRDSPCENTGVGCHFHLQGIFLTQGSNLCLPHWQADSLPLSHLGSPMFGQTVPVSNRRHSAFFQDQEKTDFSLKNLELQA